MNYFVGVDIGGTNTKIGIVSEVGELLKSTSIKTISKNGVEDTLNRIWEKSLELAGELKIEREDIKGIGMGIPGPVVDKKIVGFFANFPWEKELNISEKMEKISGIKTRLDNDVNLIALGETIYGAGKGFKKSVTIALGTGIGGGIILDGKILSGANGAGAEIGHMKIEKDGKLCGCGDRGCFEAYASATGVIREAISRLQVNKENGLYRAIDGDMNKLEAKHIFDEAKKGDKFSIDIVEWVADYLALGIANILNIINPEVVILSGGVALAGDILLDSVKEKLPKYALDIVLKNLTIKLGELGNDAGIKGAAALVKESE